MSISQGIIDLICVSHLVFFAAGMGTALYFDFRSFRYLDKAINASDILDLERIHLWILLAFSGLWVSGLCLIYVRTGFDLAAFSPKLWLKISVMILMTVNAVIISTFIMKLMRATVGKPLTSLPLSQFMAATQVAVVSMFCWTSGVILGSSVVLKTAPWDVLGPMAAGWIIALTVGGQMGAMVMRKRCVFPMTNRPVA